MSTVNHSSTMNTEAHVSQAITNKKAVSKKYQGKSKTGFYQHWREMELYQTKLSALCGLWEDHPRHQYRMEFRLEMGQLVGYSNTEQGKAFANFDGHSITMVIGHGETADRPVDHYRGRLGWNGKFITWEKYDPTRETGWRPTRKWVKVEQNA